MKKKPTKYNTKDYWGWIKAIIVICLVFAVYISAKAEDNTANFLLHDNAIIEESISKKGLPIIRVKSLHDKKMLCIVVSEKDYYYNAFKVRKNKVSKWYLRPKAGIFVWWCK